MSTSTNPALSTLEQQMLDIARQNAETNKLMAQVATQMLQKQNEPSWVANQWEGVKQFHTDHTALALAIDVFAVVGVATLAYTAYNAYQDVSATDLDLTSADRLRAVG